LSISHAVTRALLSATAELFLFRLELHAGLRAIDLSPLGF
jgi:hypothetical protein